MASNLGLSRWLAGAALAVAAAPVAAQSVVVGQLRSEASATVALATGPLTLVDFSAPASAAGNITSVTVQWAGGGISGCSPGLKVKFFRPGSSGASLSYLGERGPFPVVRSLLVLPISPPMALMARDLIGVTELGGPACGGVANTNNGVGINTALFSGDVASDRTLAEATGLERNQISIQGTGGSSEVRTGVIPVVLSSPGQFGSNFKTAVQITNPSAFVLNGRMVFHPEKTSAAPTDPSLAFTLASGQTIGYPDIVAAMGQTGVGSLDVLSSESPPPLLVVRVFTDAGAAGTSGFTEATVRPQDALQQFDTARITTPADPGNFRLNIGVRTLSAQTSVRITLNSASGAPLSTLTRAYPPDFFQQVSAADFLGGAAVGPNQTISISVDSGSVIVYGATADNRTNDSSLQLGNRDDF
jgi:hypothetical protein